ncbi:MAG TPA: AhpC/TSA family protein [Candidatus Dormibacteraeota bacterium]|nr:AhpC/TSA family protein [Candidatus Dormibacteraeota bacterium]
MRDHWDQIRALGAGAMAVGFSPAPALAALAEQLAWPAPFLADPDRLLYRRLRLSRARAWALVTPGTVGQYLAAARRGERIRRPVEDPRQLGGDALVVGGAAVRVWRPRSPDDRTPLPQILTALGAACHEARGR